MRHDGRVRGGGDRIHVRDVRVRLLQLQAAAERLDVLLHVAHEALDADHELVLVLVARRAPDVPAVAREHGAVERAQHGLERLQRLADGPEEERTVLRLERVQRDLVVALLARPLHEVDDLGHGRRRQRLQVAAVAVVERDVVVVRTRLLLERRRVLGRRPPVAAELLAEDEDARRPVRAEEGVDAADEVLLADELLDHLLVVELEGLIDARHDVAVPRLERHGSGGRGFSKSAPGAGGVGGPRPRPRREGADLAQPNSARCPDGLSADLIGISSSW